MPFLLIEQMGKQSSLKKQKMTNFSIEDWLNFYFNAKDARAKSFRLEIARKSIDKITIQLTASSPSIPIITFLQLLPGSFVKAYLNLIGHTLVGIRHKDFWADIVKDLLIITKGHQNELALKNWGSKEDVFVSDDITARIRCYQSLRSLAEKPGPEKIYGIRESIRKYGQNGIFFDGIPSHLVASSCVANNQIVYQSGSLILCYERGCSNNKNEELWLVKKRLDGIYATSTEAKDGSLKISDIREMRRFVNHYDGIERQGGLCPGREMQAARVCRLIGLHVDETSAWLRKATKEIAI